MFNQIKQAVEVDAETHYILSALSKEVGKTPEGLLKLLAQKYKQANALERSIVIKFLR